MALRLFPSIVTKTLLSRSFSTHPICFKWETWEPKRDIVVVRQDSILKSMVLLDNSQPIYVKRLDEMGATHNGWLDRMVPPPELTFDIKRNWQNRFNITYCKIKSKQHTTIRDVQGNVEDLRDILRWRFGKDTKIYVNRNGISITTIGYHRREISTLLQGLGF